MLLELHILQNFAPSNLNRDDTGSPKTADFGGYRRARISSQSLKRAIRMEFKSSDLIPAESRAIRSKRFVGHIAESLVEKRGRDLNESEGVVEAGLALLDITLGNEGKTQYLLYLSPREADAIAEFCESNWEALAAAAGAAGARAARKGAHDPAAAALAKELQKSLDGGRAADLALFGRMLADLPENNVDAASQVAHAISTHQVSAEFDYYTAVDDLKPDDTAGADMIGTVEFNSACFYRYANVDLGQLKENLGGDAELAEATVKAFLLASRDAIPTGKQNSFAARNAPSFFFTVVRPAGAWSLANAFVKPVRSSRDVSLVDASITALAAHWGELTSMYNAPSGATLASCSLGQPEMLTLGDPSVRVGSFDEVLSRTLTAVHDALEG